MANANQHTDIVVTPQGYYTKYATGNSREECLKRLGLRPNTRKPHVHYAYGHTSWEITGLGHALKYKANEPRPNEAVRTEYNTKAGQVKHTQV